MVGTRSSKIIIQAASQGKSDESPGLGPIRFKEEPLFFNVIGRKFMEGEVMLMGLGVLMLSSLSFSLIFGRFFSRRK
jgi:hypothetical protein